MCIGLRFVVSHIFYLLALGWVWWVGGMVMFWQLPDVMSIRSSISPRGGMITVQAPSVSDQQPGAFNLAVDRSQVSEASEMIDHFYRRKAGARSEMETPLRP